MKPLNHDALCWWWSLPEKKQLDIEVSCLEEGIDISDIIYLLSGQVFDDLQRDRADSCAAINGTPRPNGP